MIRTTINTHKMNLLMILFLLFACNKEEINEVNNYPALQTTKNISYNGVSVDLLIDKPEGEEFDVLMIFHGTVGYDSLIMEAANNAMNRFKNILDRKDMMLVSVAYPQEEVLFGDGIKECEAALLWLKHNAGVDLNIEINKIFLAGHSQGGYMVTRLNTMHETDGVIANAPGPLNLVFRCELEENGQIPPGLVCDLLDDEYGPPSVNPNPYFERSLLNYTSNYKSKILFVQGFEDSPIQMYSWPTFKESLLDCDSCEDIQFLELEGFGHNALFNNSQAKNEFNAFISN